MALPCPAYVCADQYRHLSPLRLPELMKYSRTKGERSFLMTISNSRRASFGIALVSFNERQSEVHDQRSLSIVELADGRSDLSCLEARQCSGLGDLAPRLAFLLGRARSLVAPRIKPRSPSFSEIKSFSLGAPLFMSVARQSERRKLGTINGRLRDTLARHFAQSQRRTL